MPGYNSQRRGTARTLPKLILFLYVLFVYICVLYYCHRLSTQLQLTMYHIINVRTYDVMCSAPYFCRCLLCNPRPVLYNLNCTAILRLPKGLPDPQTRILIYVLFSNQK